VRVWRIGQGLSVSWMMDIHVGHCRMAVGGGHGHFKSDFMFENMCFLYFCILWYYFTSLK
jgi:hypothetical protein